MNMDITWILDDKLLKYDRKLFCGLVETSCACRVVPSVLYCVAGNRPFL